MVVVVAVIVVVVVVVVVVAVIVVVVVVFVSGDVIRLFALLFQLLTSLTVRRKEK